MSPAVSPSLSLTGALLHASRSLVPRLIHPRVEQVRNQELPKPTRRRARKVADPCRALHRHFKSPSAPCYLPISSSFAGFNGLSGTHCSHSGPIDSLHFMQAPGPIEQQKRGKDPSALPKRKVSVLKCETQACCEILQERAQYLRQSANTGLRRSLPKVNTIWTPNPIR
jgi:hypothetical protein